jgi:hypothetical protein
VKNHDTIIDIHRVTVCDNHLLQKLAKFVFPIYTYSAKAYEESEVDKCFHPCQPYLRGQDTEVSIHRGLGEASNEMACRRRTMLLLLGTQFHTCLDFRVYQLQILRKGDASTLRGAPQKSLKLECCPKTACSTVVRR